MNIATIIKEESIFIEYQPIMSTHHKDFLALEALARSWDGQKVISPIALFFEAEIEGLTMQLDLICIRKALEGFSLLYVQDSSLILFINISATVIHHYLNGSILLELALDNHIPPENIVLEINELHNDSINIMSQFTKKHRAQGFLIAVDDIGAGSSNLDRIPLIKPNVMKIDKELVKNIHTSFYKEQVVNTIMQLATNIGASVVVEGIETIDDLIKVSAQGAQLIQGYFLSKPTPIIPSDIPVLKNKIQTILERLYSETKKQKNLHLKQNERIQQICTGLVTDLEQASYDSYESVMADFLESEPCIESIYILNTDGYLITDTILNPCNDLNNVNSLYTPCKRGDSVQLESYFTQLIYGGNEFWISPEYLSMATGNKSCTLSRRFCTHDNNLCIICLDFYKHKLLQADEQLFTFKSMFALS